MVLVVLALLPGLNQRLWNVSNLDTSVSRNVIGWGRGRTEGILKQQESKGLRVNFVKPKNTTQTSPLLLPAELLFSQSVLRDSSTSSTEPAGYAVVIASYPFGRAPPTLV